MWPNVCCFSKKPICDLFRMLCLVRNAMVITGIELISFFRCKCDQSFRTGLGKVTGGLDQIE